MRRVRALVAKVVLGAVFAAVPTVIQAQQKTTVVRASATIVSGAFPIAAMDSLIVQAASDSVTQPLMAHSGVHVVVEDWSEPLTDERLASLSPSGTRTRRSAGATTASA